MEFRSAAIQNASSLVVWSVKILISVDPPLVEPGPKTEAKVEF